MNADAPLLKRTGIVSDPRFAGHCMGPNEPECPERMEVLNAVLQERVFQDRLLPIPARPAGQKELEEVHTRDYLRRVKSTSGEPDTCLSTDTRTCALSHEAALYAAGGLLNAIEGVHIGSVDNAFALIRPPGHHAEKAAAKGFCLFNNVAVGARFAQRRLGLEKILIVDWDLHHGNGTQACFQKDPSVLFYSTHQAFSYPGSGALRDVGKGPGRGYTINIPLLPGCGDGEYTALLEALLQPVALEFKPDLILVSAGFDIHMDDPFGGMRVTPAGFAGMTRSLLNIAERCCRGKLVLALEGGYGLDGLRDSVREVLRELTGLRTTDHRSMAAAASRLRIGNTIWRVRKYHRRFWKSLDDPDSIDHAWSAPTLRERTRDTMSRWIAYFQS